MKRVIAIVLCVIIIALSLSACSIPFIGKKGGEPSNGGKTDNSANVNNNGGDNGSGNSWFGGNGETEEAPTNAAGFVDSSYAQSIFTTPANPDNTLNSVEDPSGDNFRFVYDEMGRIAKCYYNSNGQEVYLNYVYGEAWVEIYGFIGETIVADQVIQLPGQFNPDVGLSIVYGYYIKGYTF